MIIVCWFLKESLLRLFDIIILIKKWEVYWISIYFLYVVFYRRGKNIFIICLEVNIIVKFIFVREKKVVWYLGKGLDGYLLFFKY